MKKKIFMLIFAFAMILPCAILFAACGEGQKEHEIYLEWYEGVGFHEIEDASSSSTSGSFYIKDNQSKTFYISVNEMYDEDTLKVLFNGEEVNFDPIEYEDDGVIDSSNYNIIGKITISNPKEDIIVTTTCEEKEIKVKFSFDEQSEQEYAQNKSMISSFWFVDSNNEKHRLLPGGFEGKEFTFKSSDIINGIIFGSDYYAGYFYISQQESELDGVKQLEYLFKDKDESVGYSFAPEPLYDENGEPINSEESKKSYILDFGDGISNLYQMSYDVKIDLQYISISNLYLNCNSGSMLSFDKTSFQSNESDFKVTIKTMTGFDFTNAKLIINSTELPIFTSDGQLSTGFEFNDGNIVYTSENKLPINYEQTINYYNNYSNYNISLEDVSFNKNEINSEELCAVTIINEMADVEVEYINRNSYYQEDNVFYVERANTQNDNREIEIKIFSPNNIKITIGEESAELNYDQSVTISGFFVFGGSAVSSGDASEWKNITYVFSLPADKQESYIITISNP